MFGELTTRFILRWRRSICISQSLWVRLKASIKPPVIGGWADAFLILAFDCSGLFVAGDMTNAYAGRIRIAVEKSQSRLERLRVSASHLFMEGIEYEADENSFASNRRT